MNTQGKFLYLTLIFLLIVSSGCATTKLNAIWKDPQYKGKLKRVMVVGVSDNETMRRRFEDDFASQLKLYGTDATISYRILPSTDMLQKELVEEKVKGLGIDAVLISRLIDKKTVTIHHPETIIVQPTGYYRRRGPYWRRDYYNRYDSYYANSYYIIRNPAYTSEKVLFYMETNLYDTHTGELIWSALSETVQSGKWNQQIESFIKVMIRSMADKGLI